MGFEPLDFATPTAPPLNFICLSYISRRLAAQLDEVRMDGGLRALQPFPFRFASFLVELLEGPARLASPKRGRIGRRGNCRMGVTRASCKTVDCAECIRGRQCCSCEARPRLQEGARLSGILSYPLGRREAAFFCSLEIGGRGSGPPQRRLHMGGIRQDVLDDASQPQAVESVIRFGGGMRDHFAVLRLDMRLIARRFQR